MNTDEFRHCLNRHIEAFRSDPFCYFNETEAVSAISQSLRQLLPQQVQTADGHSVGLVHQEYPSFFTRQNTGSRSDRSKYDIVILAPQFVQEQRIKSLSNPKAGVPPSSRPFLFVLEVKLFYKGIRRERAASIIDDLEKLERTSPYSSNLSFIHFQRYLETDEKQWDTFWPTLEKAARTCTNVTSTFVVYREYNDSVRVYQFGLLPTTN